MTLELLGIAASWWLALVFAHAAGHKSDAPNRFAASLAAYRVLPNRWAPLAARLLIFVEYALIGLLAILSPLGVVTSLGVLAAYTAAITINVLRGRRDIDCGCGDEPVPVSWWVVLRNLPLLLTAAWLSTAAAATSAPDLAGILVCASTALVGFGLYRSVDVLIANQGRYQRLLAGAQV